MIYTQDTAEGCLGTMNNTSNPDISLLATQQTIHTTIGEQENWDSSKVSLMIVIKCDKDYNTSRSPIMRLLSRIPRLDIGPRIPFLSDIRETSVSLCYTLPTTDWLSSLIHDHDHVMSICTDVWKSDEFVDHVGGKSMFGKPLRDILLHPVSLVLSFKIEKHHSKGQVGGYIETWYDKIQEYYATSVMKMPRYTTLRKSSSTLTRSLQSGIVSNMIGLLCVSPVLQTPCNRKIWCFEVMCNYSNYVTPHSVSHNNPSLFVIGSVVQSIVCDMRSENPDTDLVHLSPDDHLIQTNILKHGITKIRDTDIGIFVPQPGTLDGFFSKVSLHAHQIVGTDNARLSTVSFLTDHFSKRVSVVDTSNPQKWDIAYMKYSKRLKEAQFKEWSVDDLCNIHMLSLLKSSPKFMNEVMSQVSM